MTEDMYVTNAESTSCEDCRKTVDQEAVNLIRLMLLDDVDLYSETKETKAELYKRAEQFLREMEV